MANIIDNEKVNQVAELIKESKYTVVLTGAGVPILHTRLLLGWKRWVM
jgi:formylmethanofuran dehydrogenase subunit B